MSMAELVTLRRTVEDMDLRLRSLEEGVGGSLHELRGLGLTHTEMIIMSCLLRRRSCTRETLMTALYGNRDEAPEPKILDVFVCKIRKKLELQIKCSRCAHFGGPASGGYFLTESDQARMKELLA